MEIEHDRDLDFDFDLDLERDGVLDVESDLVEFVLFRILYVSLDF